VIGVVMIVIDEAIKRWRKTKSAQLSPLAVGLGIYLPTQSTLMVVVGAVVGWFFDRRADRTSKESRGDQATRRAAGLRHDRRRRACSAWSSPPFVAFPARTIRWSAMRSRTDRRVDRRRSRWNAAIPLGGAEPALSAEQALAPPSQRMVILRRLAGPLFSVAMLCLALWALHLLAKEVDYHQVRKYVNRLSRRGCCWLRCSPRWVMR
jgi:hypothetical protein